MTRLFPIVLLAAALSWCATPFAVHFAPELAIDANGGVLLEREALTLDGKPLPLAQQTATTVEADGRRVRNDFGEARGVRFRREVSAAPDGGAVELAVQFALPSMSESTPVRRVTYELRLPLARLRGAAWQARVGRARKLARKEGVIDGKGQGQLAGEPIRQIALQLADGARVVIDGNPKGVNAQGDYANASVHGRWDLTVEGDTLRLSNSLLVPFFGGVCSAHLVLYVGDDGDFTRRHAHDSYFYYSDLKPERLFAFGASKAGPMYESIGTRAWTPENRAGWVGDAPLETEALAATGALYGAVYAHGQSARFRWSGLRRGLHLLTISAGTGPKGAGPFAIRCNGRAIAENARIAPGQVGQFTVPVWIESGAAELDFSGDWRLSALGDQLLQTTDEDFSFRRGFWRVAGLFEPSPVNASAAFAREPTCRTAFTEYPLPPHGAPDQPGRRLVPPAFDPPAFAPGQDWRRGGLIGTMGPGNGGKFVEYTTPEAIERRLDEIQKRHISTIILNGCLSRHTVPWHLPRIERNIAQITAAAHRRGMRVVDHQDFSLLWDGDSGFRVLAEHTPHLQRTIDSGLPARGFCITNREYRREFIAWITRHVQATGIDGLMLDETTFHGLNYCGCADCRRAFTRDTGLQLPADECERYPFAARPQLWRAWLAWRRHARADFWHEVKSALRRVRPDFVVLGYNTHANLLTAKHNYAMGDLPRNLDLYGTEVMPRNIFACARAVHACRRAMGQFIHSLGIPVYTLTYSTGNDQRLQYFGWALANLNGQAYWDYIAAADAGGPDWRSFTPARGNMDLARARSLARIALLFSYDSMLFAQRSQPSQSILGWSQLLDRHHYQHDFINECSLTPQGLAPYRLLVVDNATALSQKSIAAILDFARGGGTVFLSSHVAACDTDGTPYAEWPFGTLFGIRRQTRVFQAATLLPADGGPVATGAPIPALRTDPTGKRQPGKVPWKYETAAGRKSRRPAFYEMPCGKGRLCYSPLLLGPLLAAPEVNVGAKSSFQRDPATEEAALRMLRPYLDGARAWEPGDLPESILASLYRQEGETLVHLLNLQGGEVPEDAAVPALPPKEAWPPNPAFAVRIHGHFHAAVAASPELPAPVPLAVRPRGDMTEVAVPAGTFRVYALIRVK